MQELARLHDRKLLMVDSVNLNRHGNKTFRLFDRLKGFSGGDTAGAVKGFLTEV